MIGLEKNNLLTIYSEPSPELSIKGFLNIMNILKKTALTFLITMSLGAISPTVFAEASVDISETISHV